MTGTAVNPAQPLGFGEKLGYGLGDTASNFFFQVFNIFLLYYYTDVFGLSPAAVGTMFLVTVVARLVSMFGSERSIVPNRRRSESADEGSDSAGVDTDTT